MLLEVREFITVCVSYGFLPLLQGHDELSEFCNFRRISEIPNPELQNLKSVSY